MSTSYPHSTGAVDTSEQYTQQQQHLTPSAFTHDTHLHSPASSSGSNLTTSTDLSLADNYGVKSMDDILPSSKPVENITLTTVAAPLTTIPVDTTTSTSTDTLTQIPSHDSHPIITSSSGTPHGAAAVATTPTTTTTTTAPAPAPMSPTTPTTATTGSSLSKETRNMDQDDTTSNISSYGYDDYEDDDTFSCLTGDISQPCFYGHANDSTATWQSSMSESNIDLVVPKVNIRLAKQLSSHQKASSQSIGYLSIMVCGDSGIGKSALIHAFSLMPEISGGQIDTASEGHPLSDKATQLGNGNNTVMDIPTERNISTEIKEHYASTMVAAPLSKQAGELEKNICFIDTPGYGAFVDAKAVIRSTTRYLERQFQQTNDMLAPAQPSTLKLARLLHNPHGGHSHVDVCLYLILDRIKPVDIQYLRSIQPLCNIIPVIVNADLLSYDQEQTLKRKILQDLHDNHIEFYQCGYSFEQLLDFCQQKQHQQAEDQGPDSALATTAPPFSISTKPLNNKHYHKAHSAKGYLKLMHLKDTLFYKHIDGLRQSTVTKFIQWRREQTSIQQAYRSHQHRQLSSSSSTSSSYTAVLPTTSMEASTSALSSNKNKQNTNNNNNNTSSSTMDDEHSFTAMLDLETMTQKLAAREIAERIQDLASKQRRSINLHMVNYVNDQRQRLEQQKQERLLQLQQKYHIMTQQEKVKFLTSQLNGILADFGLLMPGELSSDFFVSQQQLQQPQPQQKEAPNLSSSSSSSSYASATTSVWHLYPPPDIIDHGLVFLQKSPLYLLAATILVVIVISGLSTYWSVENTNEWIVGWQK